MVITEKLLTVLCKTATKVLEALKDGKISIVEAVSIVIAIFGIVAPIKNFKELKIEIENIKPSDIPVLFKILEDNFKLADEAQDIKFKATLEVIKGVLLEVFPAN